MYSNVKNLQRGLRKKLEWCLPFDQFLCWLNNPFTNCAFDKRQAYDFVILLYGNVTEQGG